MNYMVTRFATDDEITDWDEKIIANPDGGNVFQSKEFATIKNAGGQWSPRFIMVDMLAITVFERKVFGLGKLWYIPKGPGVTSVDELAPLIAELRDFAHKNGVFAVKIEPEMLRTTETVEQLERMGLQKVTPIQPNFSTILVDISDDLEAVLANLNQKGRHAIKRATRDGVTVQRADTTDENCELFYMLLAQTAAHSFIIRPYGYYKHFWQTFSDAGKGQLFFAYHDGRVVAAAFGLVLGTKSTYKDGASIRERTAYGASHLLQWEVITWAKEQGAISHDLCGTPPSEDINDTTHKWYGVGRFKASFSKHVTDYIGAYDIVVRPVRYGLWVRFGERLAKSTEWRLHKRIWY